MSDQSIPVRVAVIGAGYFGQFHYDAWRRMPEVELVGICVRNVSSARETAETYGQGAPLPSPKQYAAPGCAPVAPTLAIANS